MNEENNTITSNECYRIITDSILSNLTKFKNGIIEESSMNKAMFHNVFNMIIVLFDKNKSEKDKRFDVYVPAFKLTQDNNNQTEFKEESESKFNNNENSNIVDENDLCPFTKIDKTFFNEETSMNFDIQMSNIPLSIVQKNTIAGGFNNENHSMVISFEKEENDDSQDIICISKPIHFPINNKHHSQAQVSHFSFIEKQSKRTGRILSFESDIHNHLSTSTNITLEVDDIKGNIINKDKLQSIKSIPLIVLPSQIHTDYSRDISSKTKIYYLHYMNDYYLICMFKLYSHMKDQSKVGLSLWNETDQFLFINTIKSFILSIGLGIKKFYEDSLRSLIYQKDNFTFENFLDFFHEILQYKEEKEQILKYKLLLYIIQINNKKEDYILKNDVNNYFILIKSKLVYEDISDFIERELINQYLHLYPKSDKNKFSIKHLSLILETFFITSGNH